MANQLMHRKPDHFTEWVSGGPIAAAALLSTGSDSATGYVVDKRAAVAGRQFQGITVSLPVDLTTVSSGQTVSATVILKHSDASASGFATLYTGTAKSVGSADTTTGTFKGVAYVSGNLLAAKRWLTATVVFQGSASDTGTDRPASALTYSFSGANEEPV